MSNKPRAIAVLASGNGTNLQALIDAGNSENCRNLNLALVVSDQPQAMALARATTAGIATLCLPRNNYPNRQAHERAILQGLKTYKIDLIVLAGYMRLLSNDFIQEYQARIINIHPSLLPLFPGMNAIQRAWESDCQESGCTIHFVDAGMDTGPIIAQQRVQRQPEDTLATFTQKIHTAEHQLLVRIVNLWSVGKIKLVNNKVVTHQ